MYLLLGKTHINQALKQRSPNFWNRNRFLLPTGIQQFFQQTVVRNKIACGGAKTTDSAGGGKSKHTIKYIPYKKPPWQPHDAKNMKLGRPMSPHLTIYAPTLPSMTSIVQRITGTIVLGYAIILAFGALVLPNGVDSYVSMIQSLNLSRPTIFLIKILFGAPFVYHYFNGIRFCMWNAGRWLAMKDVYETARKSFIATAVLTFLFALL